MIFRYKVYSNVSDIRQNITTVNLKNIAPINFYNHITEVLRNRFKDYNIKINHTGRTITIDYKEDM